MTLADEQPDPVDVSAPSTDGLEQFLVRDYARLVVALTTITGNRVIAEDAVAEAVVRGIQAVARGKQIERWERWVFVVARNHERNRIRRAMRWVNCDP